MLLLLSDCGSRSARSPPIQRSEQKIDCQPQPRREQECSEQIEHQFGDQPPPPSPKPLPVHFDLTRLEMTSQLKRTKR